MTNLPSIALERVSFQLPDGNTLFTDVSARFDTVHTGLVGRNGVGKSMLAHIMAGHLAPTTGTCTCHGTVHYLPQKITITPGQTVADLAGLTPVFNAFARIEAGSTAQSDFDMVGERWDIHALLAHALAVGNVSHLHADTPTTTLSGGQAMRVALAGAFLSQADILILDEPTTHLDRDNRQALSAQLARWSGGLIVISHDRALLGQMDRIVELSSLGLRSYGGNYTLYENAKAHEQDNAIAHLAQRKAEQKREEQLLRKQRERQDKRLAKGTKDASNTNQAAILTGRQKERSEISSGKLRMQHHAMRDSLSAQVREAASKVELSASIKLFAPTLATSQPHQIASTSQLVLPYVGSPDQAITLSVTKAQRIGLTGPNGSGKSTLLRVFAGMTAAVAGQCHVFVKTAYLDQHLTQLRPDTSILAQLLDVNRTAGESALRTRLALVGLPAERITLPAKLLSGGERLKGALACVLYADDPARLLLLDEPDNHLDLASLRALETMLNAYTGALMIVSHDEILLSGLQLTDRIEQDTSGWHMSPW